MSYLCPHCNSPHTASFRAIYEAGTSRMSGTARTYGYTSNGHAGTAHSELRGSSSTPLANRCRPPDTDDAGATFLGTLVIAGVLTGLMWVTESLNFLSVSATLLMLAVALIHSGWIARFVVGALTSVPLLFLWNASSRMDYGIFFGCSWFLIGTLMQVHEQRKLPEKMATWNRSWMCRTCARSFVV